MNINFNSFSYAATSWIKNTLVNTGNSQQKKIFVIAFTIFSCLAIGYYYLKRKRGPFYSVTSPSLPHGLLSVQNKKNGKAIENQEVRIPVQIGFKNKRKLEKRVKIYQDSSLEKSPKVILQLIFALLDANGWHNLLLTNRLFFNISKNPIVISRLLEKESFCLDKSLSFAQLAGPLLNRLNLSHTKVSDQDLQKIFQACANIKELNLAFCKHLKDIHLDKLSKNLLALDLSRCKNLTYASLGRLPLTLKVLNLSYTNITDRLIPSLSTELRFLNLSHTCLTKASLSHLQCLYSLQLNDCYQLNDKIISRLPRRLRILNLSMNPITDFSMSHLPQELISLQLKGCYYLTNRAIDNLPKKLHSLDLSDCPQLTDAMLDHLPPDLHSLYLKGCHQLTQTAINKFLTVRPMQIHF